MGSEKTKKLLKQQIQQIDSLKTKPRFSSDLKAWRDYTARILIDIWGSDSLHVKQFNSILFSPMAFTTSTPDTVFDKRFLEGLEDAKALLNSFVKEVDELGLRISEKEDSQEDICWLDSLYSNFHQVARQLRRRYVDRETINVKDEHDVQDLIYALLRLRFSDIRPEEWTPSYAGGSARMDFLLKDRSIVIEIKMTRETLGDREIGDQLIEDIGRYKEHPDCHILSCFVYDPEGWISNPSGLERDLSKKIEGLTVSVRIEPK